MLSVDESHPIRDVRSYDNVVTFEGGGAYLGLVVADPLDGSEISLRRLSEKLSFYLNSFFSEYGSKEWGTPRPGKMTIFVSINPDSDASVFSLLDEFVREAGVRGVQVEVSTEI